MHIFNDIYIFILYCIVSHLKFKLLVYCYINSPATRDKTSRRQLHVSHTYAITISMAQED